MINSVEQPPVTPDKDSDQEILRRIGATTGMNGLYFEAYTYLSQAVFLMITGVIGLRELQRRHGVLVELVGKQLDAIQKLTALAPPLAAGEDQVER